MRQSTVKPPPLPNSWPSSSSLLSNLTTSVSSIKAQEKPKSLISSASSMSMKMLRQHQKNVVFPTVSEPLEPTKFPPPACRSREKWRLSLSPEAIFVALDAIITDFIDPPVESLDPTRVLSGNFAPVDELPPTECEVVEGSIPPCLNGAYVRNGPNPQFIPRGNCHLFEGDGMLHLIRISQGQATFCSRYVKTNKYTVEHGLGHPVFPNVFSGFRGAIASVSRSVLFFARVLTGQFNPFNGIGQANTSLAFFGNKLFALNESDLPYRVELTSKGDVETLCRHDFGGELTMSMTAHPKLDQDTGEAYAFKCNRISPPFLTFFKFDGEGRKQQDVPVPVHSLRHAPFLHDFAVTKKYAIFPDVQIRINPLRAILGAGSMAAFDPKKVPRIGIIPRDTKSGSELMWFDVPGLNLLHIVNAWDEEEDDGDAVVTVAPNILSLDHLLERMDLVHGLMEKVRINLKTGTVTRQPISAMNLELAVINPAFSGRRNRYVYAGVCDPPPKVSGVVKLDLTKESGECTVARRIYGLGCFGGEPFFVACDPERHVSEAEEEDDGYLVSYVHDEKANESRFLVMDAKSPELDIVASVRLPRRVPYGFHGIFLRESDLNKCSSL